MSETPEHAPYERQSLSHSKQLYDIRGHMDEVVLDEWIDALRGGNFIQGESNLIYKVDRAFEDDEDGREDGTYHCCLGVFMELNGGFDNKYDDTDGEMLSSEYAYNNGLACSDPAEEKPQYNLQYWLAHMNDGGKTFADIADFLDENREFITKGCVAIPGESV